VDIDKTYEKQILNRFLWIWLPMYALITLIKDTFFAKEE